MQSAFSKRDFLPAQFNVSATQKLFDFCTNEIGTLITNPSGIPNAAVVGNPLRLVTFNGLHSEKLLNNMGSATAMELNCEGKYLALAIGPTLSIFDLQKCTVLREFHDHDGPIYGLAWHKKSPWLLASVSADSTLRLWDLRSHPAQLSLRRTTKPYRQLEYSPDCNYIACAGSLISIFDLNMTQSVVNMACQSPATNVSFNPAECLLATASEDRVVRFWDVDTGECVTQSSAFDSIIGQIGFEPNGHFLVINSSQQMSCIGWEPFQLFSHISYHSPTQNSNSRLTSSFPSFGPQMTILDMSMTDGHLHQLTVGSADSSKNGTICIATIPLHDLRHFDQQTISDDDAEFLLENNDGPIPVCPTANGIIPESVATAEEGSSSGENREEGDVTPESVATSSSTGESMLDSLTFRHQGIKSPGIKSHLLASTTADLKRLPPASGIKRGISSMEIGAITKSVSREQQSKFSTSGSAPLTRIRQRRQQQQESSSNTTPELGLASKRPTRLSMVPQHQPSNSTGIALSKNISSKSTLIRRGSSLNDVTCAIVTNNPTDPDNSINNMPVNSGISTTTVGIAGKNTRSRSQAQSNRLTKFASNNTSTSSSSNTSSNSTTSSLGSGLINVGRPSKPSELEEEDIEEFLQVDPKIRASVTKQKNEMQNLNMTMASVHGNIAEFIVEKASRFDDVHVFARLLEEYIRRPERHNMGLNASFLDRINALLVHRNSNYTQLAINFLDMVTSRFGDSIRHGLASQEFTIGVDVAAEQRFDRCNRSKNALFQIRLNTAFNTERMDATQRRRYEKEIIPRIDSIIDKSSSSKPSNGSYRAN